MMPESRGSLGPVKSSSQTALTAAAARAAHLLYDQPPYVFEDTAAAALLGDRAEELLAYHRLHGDHIILRSARAQAVARSRFTEDVLAAAVARGVDQYVILGAGFDSYVYRVATPGLRVFEVDHPATQASKRAAARSLQPLTDLTYVPVDFEYQSLIGELLVAGFDRTRPAVVSWLGVTLYLTRDAIAATLAGLAKFAEGTQIVFDYLLPEGLRDREGTQYAAEVGAVAANRGEPWLTFLTPEECTALVHSAGFGEVHQLSPIDAVPDGLWNRDDALMPSGLAMLAHAVV
jgi:methyltransferase (TIGR00027 family)